MIRSKHALAVLVALAVPTAHAATYVLRPATVANDEEFEAIANALEPGDELILRGGVYSQTGRRTVTAKGTAEKPIIIRAADGDAPILTRPEDQRNRRNNIEFVDCSHLMIRGLRFRGGSSGVRFIRGDNITFEDCEIFETGNNALTMNSGDCDRFVVRRNHIHHTGLSESRPAEGEGMYIGCHDGSCRTTNSLFEGNYIHHTRGTSDGGNDGIEIKAGSFGNVIRENVIHDTNIERRYPGILVYGGGDGLNVVEGNVIWNAGEGIQVVSDAIIRNNIIFDCSATGITAAPHQAVRQMRNVTIVNNTIVSAPIGVRLGWENATGMIFANNAVFCPSSIAVRSDGIGDAILRNNAIAGRLAGISANELQFLEAGPIAATFVDPSEHNYWPAADSALIGRADLQFAPSLDFNGTRRMAPFDAGAYEVEEYETNPGWKLSEGFKRNAD